MSDKLGQESAFPELCVNDPHLGISNTPEMNKRFYAACAAMQGIVSNSTIHSSVTPERIIELCYIIADELLKQENK